MAGTEYQVAVAFKPLTQRSKKRLFVTTSSWNELDGGMVTGPREDRTVSKVSGQLPAVGSQTCPVAGEDDHLCY